MKTLKLRIGHQRPEPIDDRPEGLVWVEQGPHRAVLLTPDEIDDAKTYPLITLLHGAGRQDELLLKGCKGEPERRQAFFLIPRSLQMTWDLIAFGIPGGAAEGLAGGPPSPDHPGSDPSDSDRPDLDFLEFAYDLIWRRFPIDPERQALLGYSDGASYALSVGLSNPDIFSAVMVWAAGFLAIDQNAIPEDAGKPPIYLEYGTHDELFDFEQVAKPMRRNLEQLGYQVSFHADQGGRHWPSSTFQEEALDWFFSEDWKARS
ncbi:MAG: hypothetical protein GY723_14895 [bacterium]|nr:hypothetical protein [bacterium]MCP5069406.1 hypothetical protein [bacterium]